MKTKILSYLLKKDLDFWEMARLLGYFADFAKTLKKIEKEGLIKIKNSKLSLTKKGRELSSSLNIFPQDPPSFKISFKLDKPLLKKFKKVRKKLLPKLQFDQLQIIPEGIIKKIEVMRAFGDLKGKKIICLGDDDMTATALALTNLPQEITVLDIDERIINYENKILQKLGYKKTAFFCDLLKPLPSKFVGNYDVFLTEPPDTLKGNTLFFSRGIECIKKEGGIGYIGVSQNDFKRVKYLHLQKNILKMGALITAIFPKFELYETYGDEFEWIFGLPEEIGLPKKPWFSADLIRTEISKKSKPLISGKAPESFKKKFLKTDIYC